MAEKEGKAEKAKAEEEKNGENGADATVGATAEDLAKEFRENSVAEFFKKNRQMLGLYGKIRTLTTIVHEYVTNSLDACEEARTLPEIEVKLDQLGEDYYEVTVRDNGPGLTRATVGKALGKLLAGTKFHRLMQSRGQQGIGACMKSDTLVPMADGRVLPIKEIVDGSMVGEEILSLDLETMKLVPGKILKCWKPKNPLFVKIRTLKGMEISLTPENPVLALQGGKPVWIRADEIAEGMKIAAPNRIFAFANEKLTVELFDENEIQVDTPELVAGMAEKLSKKFGSRAKAAKAVGVSKDVLRNWVSRKMPNGRQRGRPTLKQLLEMAALTGIGKDEVMAKVGRIGRKGTFAGIPHKIDAETAWIAGILAGDGHMSSERDDKWGVNIAFSNKDIGLVSKYREIIEKKFGLKSQQYFHEGKRYYTVQCSSKVLSEIMKFFGVKRGNKSRTFELSSGLLSMPDEIIASYLKGIFDAEGSVSAEKKTVAFIVYNKKALKQVFHALLRLGIHSNINKNGAEERLTITGKENLYRFHQKVSFSSKAKSEALLGMLEGKVNSKADTIEGIGPKVVGYLRGLGRPLTCLPPASYSALHQKSMSRNSLRQVLETVGIEGAAGRELGALADADVSWLEVTRVEFEKNAEEFVYDLEIEKHHNFVAGGIICHNSGCTMLSQMTTGKATQVITGTGSETISLEVTIDPKKNEPKLSNVEELKRQFKGTAIKAKFKDVKYIQSDQSPLEYLRRTAIANPHAEIKFIEPSGEKTTFHRTLGEIPLRPIEVQPHPKGATVDELISMAKYTDSRKTSSFLKNEFDRMGDKAIEEIEKKVDFDLNKDPKKLSWEEAEEIIKAIRTIDFIAPRMDALRPIGEDRIKKSLQSIVQPEFLSVIERKPSVYKGGFPFQIEAAIAFGGEAGKANSNSNGSEEKKGAPGAGVLVDTGKHIEVMRFANRTPLLFDGGSCAITKAVNTIDWKRYGIKDLDNAPLTVLVNISSVFVPYTSAGKQAIADEEEIVEEIRLALMDTGRRIARYIVGKRKEAEKMEKKRLYMRYAPEVAGAVSELTKENKKELEKKLMEIVLKKLKIDEAQEKKLEEESDEEIEKELEKELKKEGKSKKKEKGKKSAGAEAEEEGE